MTAPGTAAPNPLAALLHLEAQARSARDLAALEFVIANETWQLAPYRQAAVFRRDPLGRLTLTAVSGLAVLEGDAPFTLWINRLAAHAVARFTGPRAFTAADVPAEFRDGWTEWLPPHALFLPLAGPDGERLGAVVYGRDEPWSEQVVAQLARLHEAYGYSLWALTRGASLWARLKARLRRASWWWKAALAAAVLALLVPVRMSVLAPAEVIALEAQVVAAPMDGVVERFQVQPNQEVTKDQPLFNLDPTTLASRREVALKALEVARADALTAAQKAFDSDESRAELAVRQGRVREREAEVAYLDTQLARVEVRSPAAGVAVFGDPNDWIGRPVQTGERILLLADPADAGVLVWLPVADAINLEPGAEIRLFLHVAPLAPLAATLTQTSYQATASPDGIAAYRIRGRFEGDAGPARIGLKGTAKVYGERRPLAYLLFRRPLATLREWTGL
ncbi:MAG TPA: HlyD family efflux transporter periplasmic adaptor subunit [Pelomicrobium sp.]|nr:HlyD family efflux transporter periplasmic adaptor subunit [Pelomicrobium sp.]